VQTDFKFVIGYSSVSHMGFVLLGLMTLNSIGLTGAVLQMYSHGVIAGLLFAIVGRIVYERTHTRQFEDLEHMHLARRLPFAAWAFVIAGMASMGLPGFSGFVAELQVLVGSWHATPWWTAAAGIGIVVGVAYTWRALQKAFFSDIRPTAEDHPKEGWQNLGAITWPEVAGVSLLTAASLIIGIYPKVLLDTIEPAVKALLAGGGQ
jgi:NADH-quinone oxidoreductase subunit M